MKKKIIEQTDNAFDFINKLYQEVSYLIKEIEGALLNEKEEFIIIRPSGYSISARSSTGLESNFVNLWLLRKLSVGFIPRNSTKLKQGQTTSEINNQLKVLYVKIILNDKTIKEPTLYSGILYNIKKKPTAKKMKKFENIMSYLEYYDHKFNNYQRIEYDDASISFNGKLIKNNLFDLNDSDTIYNKVLKPSLKIFRDDKL